MLAIPFTTERCHNFIGEALTSIGASQQRRMQYTTSKPTRPWMASHNASPSSAAIASEMASSCQWTQHVKIRRPAKTPSTKLSLHLRLQNHPPIAPPRSHSSGSRDTDTMLPTSTQVALHRPLKVMAVRDAASAGGVAEMKQRSLTDAINNPDQEG